MGDQQQPFDAEAAERDLVCACGVLDDKGFAGLSHRLDLQYSAALDEIERLRPFEARCHAIDRAEQRLAARTAADADAPDYLATLTENTRRYFEELGKQLLAAKAEEEKP